jgi:hypothetical protein
MVLSALEALRFRMKLVLFLLCSTCVVKIILDAARAGHGKRRTLSRVSDHIDSYPQLLEATREELSLGLESGLFTSTDLVRAYLLRIDETSESLNAVIETNPDALSIVAKLDAECAQGTIRGPLHGIPVLLNDNIATHDKLNNTAGSYALLGATVSPTLFTAMLQAVLGTPAVTAPVGKWLGDTPVVKNDFGNLHIVAPNIPMGMLSQ